MFCPFCGSQVSETTTFCPECGRNLATEKVGNCAQETNHNATPASFASADAQNGTARTPNFAQPTPPQPAPTQPASPQAPSVVRPGVTPSATGTSRQEKIRLAEQNGQGMKWYKFLVYFSYFAGAVIAISSGISSILGLSHMTQSLTPEMAYQMFPQLKTIDISYGILLLFLMSALFIYGHILMARFSRKAPIVLYILYIANAMINTIYTIIIQSTITEQLDSTVSAALITANNSSIVTVFITIAITIWLNVIYFRKRSYLFTEG